MTSPEQWVRLGVVGRPHGIHGAVKVHLDNSESQTLRAGLVVQLVAEGPAPRPGAPKSRTQKPYTIKKVQPGILTFVDVVGRDAAEAIRHAILEVQRGDFTDADAEAADDDAFLIDLIGATVRTEDGRVLGVIKGFTDNVAQTLAEVKPASGPSVLVPFVPPIVVAINDDGVVLAPPSGLFDDDAIVVNDSEGAAGLDDDS